ncbi:type II toxin-antitoxin system RelE/ParE family toxin [Chryseobacterium taklimakanense]|uniref:type II toxin-antitoxin system RelE/ParE family toxin n=1 Tax=Chryseobacterium taklimakanense TaxID=536441 RepID=UPI0038990B9B
MQPFSGKEIGESSCRILIFGNYSLVYKFTETQIQIVSFWDNRQNPEKLQQILGV